MYCVQNSVTIITRKLTITGGKPTQPEVVPFTPVVLQTQKLCLTAGSPAPPPLVIPFTPVVITTEKITVTCK